MKHHYWHKDDVPRVATARRLMGEWLGKLGPTSTIGRKMKTPEADALLGFGQLYPWVVVRLMVEEFRAGTFNHWFLFLHRITGATHVRAPDRGKVAKMAESWVRWWDECSQSAPFRFPEHAKLKEVQPATQAIGRFLDSTKYVLCRAEGRRYVPVEKGVETILAEHFDIDLDRIAQEKDDMVAVLRQAQTAK